MGDFLRLQRCEGYVKALFRLSALLVNTTGGNGSGPGSPRWVHTDPRFRYLIDRLDAQARTPAGFSAQSYSKMFTALAHLGFSPNKAFLDRLRAGMQARMEAQPGFLDPYSLSHVISAFVNLQYHPGDEFMALFVDVRSWLVRACLLARGWLEQAVR